MTDAIGNNGDLARLMASLNAQAARSGGTGLPAIDDSQAGGTRDMITLSKAAQAAAALWDQAAGSGVSLSTGGSGDALDTAMSKVEEQLQEVMAQLGIFGDFDFSLSVQPDGSVKVNSDDPRAAKLEEAINADPELRKSLVEANALARAQRVAAAMSQALDAARGDSSQAGDVFNWVRGIIEQTQSADPVFTYADGSLAAGFVDADGKPFGVDEGLNLTA